MKKLNKLVGAIAISAIAPAAFAHMDHFREPYLGVEVLQTNQAFKSGYGDAAFKKNPQELGVFGGFKFMQHFGVEAGWDYQLRKKRSAQLDASDLVAAAGLTATLNVNTVVQGSHPYLGLFGEYKYESWRFQGLLAASFSKIKTTVTAVSLAVAGIDNVIPVGTTGNFSKSKVVPMVKLSAMYDFTENFGVRVTALYRNTSSIKITYDTAGDQFKLKDTLGLGLGVVYTFA